MPAGWKYLFCSIGLLAIASHLPAQTEADSLKHQLGKSPNDTNKLVLTFAIGEHYWFIRSVQQAVPYLQAAVQLSDHFRYYPYQVNALNLLANAKLKLGQYDSVFYYLRLAEQKSKTRREYRFHPLIWETYHHVYYELGDYTSALNYALKSAKGYEESGDPTVSRQAIYAYISIGQIFREMGQPDKALGYFKKGLASGKGAPKPPNPMDALLNIAGIYESMQRFSEARQLYDSVILLDRQHYNHESSLFAYEGLGKIALRQKEYTQAVGYFTLALEYARNANQDYYIDNLFALLGHASALAGAKKAPQYFRHAIRLATAASDNRCLYTTYTFLSENERRTGNYQKALLYQDSAQRFKDSLISAEKIRFANNLEVLHRTQEQEGQIYRLQVSGAHTKLALFQRNRLLWAAACLLVAAAFGFVFYYRNSQHKEALGKQLRQLQEEKIKALQSESRLDALQGLVKGQDMERARIARDLHDSVGSLLSIVLFRLGTLRQRLHVLQQNEVFEDTMQLTEETLQEVRRISHNLAPEALVKLGLKEAVLQFCRKMESHGEIIFSVQLYGLEERLPLAIEVNVFAIIQELLQNVIKHSAASKVIVQINRIGDGITIIVEDNGKGFATGMPEGVWGLGLTTIRNRVLSMNGTLELESEPHVGTTATIHISVAAPEATT